MTPELPPELPAVELHGWVEAGMAVAWERGIGSRKTGIPQVTIDLARLQMRYDEGHYGSMLQVSAERDTVRLLDAAAWLGSVEQGLSVKAGLFKTPLSLDFGQPAPKLVLPHRPWLVGAATRRELGVQARLQADASTVWVGVYDAVPDLAVSGQGVRTVAAAEVVSNRWLLHAGASTWLRGEHVAAALGPVAPAWDHLADLGVRYDHAGTKVALEGLASHEVGGPSWQAGVAMWASHRFPTRELEVEPALGWETATFTGEVMHRATSAINLHASRCNVVGSISWDVVWSERPATHVVRTQLQTGF